MVMPNDLNQLMNDEGMNGGQRADLDFQDTIVEILLGCCELARGRKRATDVCCKAPAWPKRNISVD